MAPKNTISINIIGDATGVKKALGVGEKALDDFGKETKSFGSKLQDFGKAAAIGFAAVGAGAVAIGRPLFNLGMEIDGIKAKSQTVFGDSLRIVEQWAAGNAAAMGLGASAATGLASNIGDLLVPMGFTRDEAAKMSTDLVGLSGALSAWSGGTRTATEVSDILAAALLGERDALQGLGISISAAEIEARLLQQGQEDLTGAALQQAEAIATQQLVMEKSTDAQAAFKDSTLTLNEKMLALTGKFEEAKEKLATVLMPAFHAATDWIITTGIPKFDDFAAGVKELGRVFDKQAEPITEFGLTMQEVLKDLSDKWADFQAGLEIVGSWYRAFVDKWHSATTRLTNDLRSLKGAASFAAELSLPGLVMKKLPFFHSGGVVPGPLGANVPIMAQAGETVLPIGAAGASPTYVTVNVPNYVGDKDELITTVVEGLSRFYSGGGAITDNRGREIRAV